MYNINSFTIFRHWFEVLSSILIIMLIFSLVNDSLKEVVQPLWPKVKYFLMALWSSGFQSQRSSITIFMNRAAPISVSLAFGPHILQAQ